MVVGVSHIALGVTDVDKALTFYRGVLGMEVTADYFQDLPPDRGPELHKGRHIKRRQVWLRWGTGEHASALTLDELHEPVPADKRGDIYDLGVHHFSFWVDDVDAVIDLARAGGFDVVMPHVASAADYGEPAGSRIQSVFLRDPDGNLVQCDRRV